MPDSPALPTIADQQIGPFLADLAAKRPTPGGGAVASLVGALASALGQMVVAYSAGRKDLAQHAADLDAAKDVLERARAMLLELAAEDAAAYGWLSSLWKLPEDDPRRREEYPAAVAAAVQVPLATCAACGDVLRLLESLAGKTNRRLDSDLAISAILAEAGARAAAWNVRINLPLLPEGERGAPQRQVEQMLLDAAARREKIERMCSEA